jgi:multidrug efflux pump subunit AcrB
VRPLEISVEIPQATLRAYGLTLEGIAQQIGRGAVELPGGGVKTSAGEVLLRTAERRNLGDEFRDIVVVSNHDGADVRVGEIAEIYDGFADTDDRAFYDGKPAVRVDVFRVGSQTPAGVAALVKGYAEEFRRTVPAGVGVATWMDRSEVLSERLGLLVRNATLGLVLVLLVLGLFLEPTVAGWVTLGIPVSVLGAIMVMPLLGVSINMVTLFAFILTLGVIVDDAIVVGENIYDERRRGVPALAAAVGGVRSIATPVTFSVITNIVAFVPLLALPGTMGKIFIVIPLVVIPVFAFSLMESLFVLPAHLGHARDHATDMLGALGRVQRRFAQGLDRFIREVYTPRVRVAMTHRYVTLAVGLMVLLVTVGFVKSGRIDFTFLPRIDSDRVTASAVLPYGTPVAETEVVQHRLVTAAQGVLADYGGAHLSRGTYTSIGGGGSSFGPRGSPTGVTGGHLVDVQVYLVPSDQREFTASTFANEWRQRIGEIPGLEALTFDYSTGPSASADIEVELSHPNTEILEQAAGELATALSGFAGVTSIDDGFVHGKAQLDFTIRPEGRSYGVTAADLGRQIRSAFYGAEAIRQQRGRNELKVMVRLPKRGRTSEYNVEELLIRTPTGGEVPLMEAANVERGRAYTEINRADGRRVVTATANVIAGEANATKIGLDLDENFLPQLVGRYPGLQFSFEGGARSQRESLQTLRYGFLLALIVMFGLLAVIFESYVQPAIVLMAIPFGIIGAVIGHVLMGFDLSVMSLMGMVALGGVVVNDSLVLVHEANARRASGDGVVEAIVGAAERRFRPIILTSLTTFFGLLPMIFEPSVQARFLIPMAISLGYGVLFATPIVLFMVPALYLAIDALRGQVAMWTRSPAPTEA